MRKLPNDLEENDTNYSRIQTFSSCDRRSMYFACASIFVHKLFYACGLKVFMKTFSQVYFNCHVNSDTSSRNLVILIKALYHLKLMPGYYNQIVTILTIFKY